jgi:hypothetical protein
VLYVRKPDDKSPDCAIWNFPAGEAGQLTLRLRLNEGFGGASLSLTDRFFDPDDLRGQSQSVFSLAIGADGRMADGAKLSLGARHTLVLSWDIDQRQCRATVDGETVGALPINRSTSNGISYLRVRSTAEEIDSAGFFVESVQAEVTRTP